MLVIVLVLIILILLFFIGYLLFKHKTFFLGLLIGSLITGLLLITIFKKEEGRHYKKRYYDTSTRF